MEMREQNVVCNNYVNIYHVFKVYDAIQKESEHNKLNQKKKKKNNQKKEKGTMSLDEFQNLDPSQIETGTFHKSIAGNKVFLFVVVAFTFVSSLFFFFFLFVCLKNQCL